MSFWTGSLEQGVNVAVAPSAYVLPTIFKKKILFYDVSYTHTQKNTLWNNCFLVTKKVSCLLKTGQQNEQILSLAGPGFEGLGDTPPPNIPLGAPSGVWEDNRFVLNSRNYCCLTIKLTYPIALFYSLSFGANSPKWLQIGLRSWQLTKRIQQGNGVSQLYCQTTITSIYTPIRKSHVRGVGLLSWGWAGRDDVNKKMQQPRLWVVSLSA